jgi:hypothetical protein
VLILGRRALAREHGSSTKVDLTMKIASRFPTRHATRIGSSATRSQHPTLASRLKPVGR